MKTWLKKLFEQLEVGPAAPSMNEDRATILFVIDTYQKHLLDTESQPSRKVRETLDEFAKLLVKSPEEEIEKVLFKFRQFFSAYRIDEYTYTQKTFDEFKSIIWDFADQLGEDAADESKQDKEVNSSLDQLREAVESNSIDALKTKAREFIDTYVELQTHREDRKSRRLVRTKKNLQQVRKKLVAAHQSLMTDHLTQAFNRRSFDEQMKNHVRLFEYSKSPVCLLALDIDFFKKINDAYGHDIGDFVLKECVHLLQEVFSGKEDFVARIGGEEFAIILPDHQMEDAVKKADAAMARIRKEVFIQGNLEIKFTVSMGLAQLQPNETTDQWLKRADQALYQSKTGGRNKYTIAGPLLKVA